MQKLTGRCLCGTVSYEITDDLPQYQEWPPGGRGVVRQSTNGRD
ncbi:MAG: hypothetical protein NTV32_05150 [Gammaproteobacteria bacterium]|jgi:hypothetical protein|nr:hypothetical protein [Gammaproteobacteria bacterium]